MIDFTLLAINIGISSIMGYYFSGIIVTSVEDVRDKDTFLKLLITFVPSIILGIALESIHTWHSSIFTSVTQCLMITIFTLLRMWQLGKSQ